MDGPIAFPRTRLSLSFGLVVLLAVGCGTAPAPEPAPGPVQIGYGSVPEGMTTGAISSLDEKQIRRRNALRVEDLFESIAGVEVIRRGGHVSLNVRKPGSAAAHGEPLVVIDGIAVPAPSLALAFSGLAVEDIARIDVLKDGTTAIYGRRGGNGVILVTTKRAP